MSGLKPNVLANLLERLKADGGRYLLSIALTKEERGAMLPPTYGSKEYTRWLTEDEHAALCAALAPSPDTAAHLDTVAGIEQFAKYRVPWGDTSDTLARCKTCGHEAAFREPEHRGYEHAMISVECSNTSCGMKTPPHYTTRADAAKAWNRKSVGTASLVRALLDAARQLQRSAELCGQHSTEQASAEQLRAQAALLRAYAASMTPIDA